MKFNLKVILLIILILILIGIIVFLIINRKKNIDNFEDFNNLPTKFIIDIGEHKYGQKTGLYYPEGVVNLTSYLGILLGKQQGKQQGQQDNKKLSIQDNLILSSSSQYTQKKSNFVSSMYIKSIIDSNFQKNKTRLFQTSDITEYMIDNPNYFTILSTCQNDQKLKEKYLNNNNIYFDKFLGDIETECDKNNLNNVDYENSKVFVTDINYIIRDGQTKYNTDQNILDIITNHIYCEGPLCIQYESTEREYNLDYYGIDRGDDNSKRIVNGIIIGWTKGNNEKTNLKISIPGSDGSKEIEKPVGSEDKLPNDEGNKRQYKINLQSQAMNIFSLNCVSDFISLTVTVVNAIKKVKLIIEGVGSIISKINWGDGTSEINETHKYNETGVYEIKIYGRFPEIKLEEKRTTNCIISVNKYGEDTNLVTLKNLKKLSKVPDLPRSINKIKFIGCTSFNQDLSNWNVENVTDMSNMFFGCTSFNQNLNNWNTKNVTDMNNMFNYCKNFNNGNQPLNWERPVGHPNGFSTLSKVTDMSFMFSGCTLFDQDISNWNVENVTNMSKMFIDCTNFNQDISKWNVEGVKNMVCMFKNCSSFNKDLSNWNVGNVTKLVGTFSFCTSFNQPLNTWDVGKVTDMSNMFQGCTRFNQRLNNWEVGNVTDMSQMFLNCTNFNNENQPLNWERPVGHLIGFSTLSKVTNMSEMFYGCTNFNQDINNWNVGNVNNMSKMFIDCTSFNQPLNDWNVENVTNMIIMFQGCTNFNQPLNNWNVSKVINMSEMFIKCTSFNQPLNIWNTKNVKDMDGMFIECTSFNQPLNNWNVGNVTNMSNMFIDCTSFNQDLSKWNVGNVQNMSNMFQNCTEFNNGNQPLNWERPEGHLIGFSTLSNVQNMSNMFLNCTNFNQPLNDWNVENVTDMSNMFRGCTSFNQSLNSWNISPSTIITTMFTGCTAFETRNCPRGGTGSDCKSW